MIWELVDVPKEKACLHYMWVLGKSYIVSMYAHVHIGVQMNIHVGMHIQDWPEVNLVCYFSGIIYLGCLGVCMLEFFFFFYCIFACLWNSEDNLQDSPNTMWSWGLHPGN